jgi:HSP20 family protein
VEHGGNLSITGFNDPFDIFFHSKGGSGMPTNVGYNKQEIILQVSLPGYSRTDIDIDVVNGRLAVSAKEQSSLTAYEFTTRDIKLGAFKQAWHLPKSVNTEAIEANYDSGILTIRIPYLQNPREASRKITVQ